MGQPGHGYGDHLDKQRQRPRNTDGSVIRSHRQTGAEHTLVTQTGVTGIALPGGVDYWMVVVSEVLEPGSLSLFATGLAAMLIIRKTALP